jgi:hypothetical protein
MGTWNGKRRRKEPRMGGKPHRSLTAVLPMRKEAARIKTDDREADSPQHPFPLGTYSPLEIKEAEEDH